MAALFLIFGALHGALSVALGAFGSHALQSRLDSRALEIFETAVRYHAIHALALIVVALLLSATGEPIRQQDLPANGKSSGRGSSHHDPGEGAGSSTDDTSDRRKTGSSPSPAHRNTKILVASGWTFFFGILLFPGALYLLSLAGLRPMGAVAPVGGTAFIAGWLLLAVGGGRALRTKG